VAGALDGDCERRYVRRAARMRFAYYKDLSPDDRRTYRHSDAIDEVRLAGPGALRPLAAAVEPALVSGETAVVRKAAARLAGAIVRDLGAPPVDVEVLAVRPKWDTAELHGQYTYELGETARIELWMRTAHHRRVVAWRTLLRTLLHELCHHLDYHHFHLPDSFHTEGFFKRESSLFHQLIRPPSRSRK
jgi:hypothetical protein